MFGGLELKGSNDNKKRDVDVQSVAKDLATNAVSGFSFLQTSAAPNTPNPPNPPTSGFSFLSSMEPSSIPVPEDVAPINSSFSFISSAPSTPSHGLNIMNNTVSSSGFSFVDAMVDNASLSANVSSYGSATVSSYGDDVLSLTAPTIIEPTTPAPVESFSQLNFLDTKQVDAGKGDLDSTHNVSSVAHTVSWGPSTVTDAKTTGEKLVSQDNDILSMKNPVQPIGQGIMFEGAAASKATGAIKKRSRTYKVGTGASDGSAPAGHEQATTSSVESHPQPESDATTVSTDDRHAPNQVTRPGSIAEEAEKALQKAAVFIEEKSAEAEIVKAADPIVKVPLVGIARAQSTSKDLAYEQAVAAAQEAKGIIKQSSGSSFMSGFFKRSSNNAPGMPTFSNHSSSSSTKTPSFIPSVKITSASVDTDIKVFSSSFNASNVKMESHQPVTPPDVPLSSSNHDNDKEIPSATILVKESEKHDTTSTQIVSPIPDAVKQVKMSVLPVHEEATSDIKPGESEHKNGSLAIKDRMNSSDSKVPTEPQTHGKYGLTVVPSNRPSSLLDAILNDFYSRCLRTNDLIERIKVRQMTHLSDLKAAEKELHLTSYRISQAESQQIIAAEREEFDLAEVLAADIEKYMMAKSEQERIVQKAHEAIKDLDKQQQSAIDTVAHEFCDVQEKLITFKKEQETVGRENVMAVLEQFALTSKRFSAENDRLTSDLKNIERDEVFVEQERKELENQISEQSQDLYNLRDTARAQLEAARKEVEELKKLLAAKEAQASQLTLVVAQHDASIMQVRSKFSRQLTRIEKKEMAVKESRNEWEGEQATFKRQKEKHETEVSAHSEYLLSKEKIILRAQQEISSIDNIKDIVMKEVFVGDVDISSESVSLVDFESSVVALQVAVDEANQELLVAQAAVDRIQDEISSIEAKLPMLEAVKREAAAKRDFKAAGKASKEIKDLTARRDECETALSGESKDRLERAHRDLEKVTSDLYAQREAVQVKRIEIERSQMIQVAKRIRQLQMLKKQAEDVPSKIDDTDGVGLIASTASTIIATRIASLMTHGDQLGVTYGGWDEILQESCCDTKDPSSKDEQVEPVVLEATDTHSLTEVTDDPVTPIGANITDPENAGEDLNGDSAVTPIIDDIGVNNHENKINKKDAIIRYKEISTTLKLVEREIEKAVGEENYDEAAQLEETMKSLSTEMESLGVSETDIIDEDGSDERSLGADDDTNSATFQEEATLTPAEDLVEIQ